MTTGFIQPVKYIFLDVVAYSQRTIEAQCYIIGTLNRIVKGAIKRYHINEDSVIYMPTGDGICIALLGSGLEYDIHVTVAKEILRRVHVNASRVNLGWKKFDIRIGINQADDNIITDINGHKNVAGAGINNARRIMDLADAGQILVSSIVYENLHPRKGYNHAFSEEYKKTVKHRLVLKMHQLVSPGTAGVNINPPSSLAPTSEPEPKLPKLTAYYFAHSIKNEATILNIARESPYKSDWIRLLLWFLSKDSENASNAPSDSIYVRRIMPDTGSGNFEGHFNWFNENVPAKIAIELSDVLVYDAVPPPFRGSYLSSMSDDLIVQPNGKEKLKKDWPEIWTEFGFEEI